MAHLYNVIWADDNIQALLEDGRSLFERNGIQLIPFTNAQEAIDYLENNARFIDAIIVDAKFSKAGEAFDEEGKSFPGLSLFMRQLSGLRKTYGMPYPCWIYTGFGDLLLDKYDADDLAEFEGVIDKKSNYDARKEWIESMCERIAETKTEAFRVRQENADLFALCTENYLGKDVEKQLLDILTFKEGDEVAPFNKFRDVEEEILDLLAREGVIDNKTQKIAIGDRIDRLHSACKGKIPQYIIPSLRLLLSSSSLSHADTLEKEAVNSGQAPFLYATLLMALKTVMAWLRPFVDDYRKTRVVQEEAHQTEQEDNLEPLLKKLDPNLMGTDVGTLLVRQWQVRLDGNKYATVTDRQMIPRSYKPGMKVRVRTGQDFRGNLVVNELIGPEQ